MYMLHAMTVTNCTNLITGSRPSRGDGTMNIYRKWCLKELIFKNQEKIVTDDIHSCF